jgi:hypothetical protein
VSRRFVAATEHALAELLAADLSGLDLVALLIDGIRVAAHTCVVALGITLDGTKVPLALAEGAAENATVVGDLLAGLRDRGLDTTRPCVEGRFRWSGRWWACQDLNLGPHPYQLNAGNRCADRHSCRSRPTVGAQGMRSISVLVCVVWTLCWSRWERAV